MPKFPFGIWIERKYRYYKKKERKKRERMTENYIVYMFFGHLGII